MLSDITIPSISATILLRMNATGTCNPQAYIRQVLQRAIYQRHVSSNRDRGAFLLRQKRLPDGCRCSILTATRTSC